MTTVDGSACVLGLGRVGTTVARRFLAHGIPVTVWNRSPGPVQSLTTLGAEAAPSPAHAARAADLVLVTVADWAATRAVLLGPHGALADGPLPGVLVTTSPTTTEDLAALSARTPALLDLSVLGDHRHLATGRACLYAGGRAEVLARARPWLDLLGAPVRHVGELGSATRLRLVLNLLVGVHVQGLAEAVTLGAGIGLDPRLLLDVVTRSGFTPPMSGFAALRLASGDHTAADVRLRLVARELNLAVASARQAGVELPLAEAAQRTHDTALVLGLGDEDCTAIAKVVAAAPPRATVQRPPASVDVATAPAGADAGPVDVTAVTTVLDAGLPGGPFTAGTAAGADAAAAGSRPPRTADGH